MELPLICVGAWALDERDLHVVIPFLWSIIQHTKTKFKPYVTLVVIYYQRKVVIL